MSEKQEGQKLPYFHRELDEKDKHLVGKNIPQPICSSEAVAAAEKMTSASAWNSAQSWEERDATAKCKEALIDIMDLPASFADFGEKSGLVITACDDVIGNASVTHSRGKVRYMYEFNVTLKFEAAIGNTTYKGKINCVDLSNDQDEDDYSILHEWTGSTGRPSNVAGGDKIRKAIEGMAFKNALHDLMQQFEKRFRDMFK